jgi:23S rRNA (uridine2552-2'-O)-methyltransferase
MFLCEIRDTSDEIRHSRQRMNKRSRGWLRSHNRDTYVRRARESSYRARSAFKLEELDRRERLFKPGQTVLDLGAAPGSWAQYAAKRVMPRGRVLAVDRLEITPIEDVTIIQGDLTDPAVLEQCQAWLGDARADLVISDAAPNITGIAVTDQANMQALAEVIYAIARQTLSPGGVFLIKLFQGEAVASYIDDLREHFAQVVTRKPAASKNASREIYVLARGYAV